MGFEISILGELGFDKPLSKEHAAYLTKFSNTRRMKRSNDNLESIQDPIREAVGLPLGNDGEYFVGSKARMGQDFGDSSILSDATPPANQPNLWCGWAPDKSRKKLRWNGIPQFDPVAWLHYLISHFFQR